MRESIRTVLEWERPTKHDQDLAAGSRTDEATSVLLVMPPVKGLLDGFASGLVCLYSHLRNRRPEVRCEILDMSSHCPEEIRAAFQSAREDHRGRKIVVGITTTTATYQSALRCAEFAKMELPGCFVIFGGHHATADARNVVVNHPRLVDAVSMGEGERALESLVANFQHLDQVPGLAFLEGGSFRQNAPPTKLRIEELDELDVLYRGGLVGTPGKFEKTTYVSARGCPLRCAFCSVANDAIRARSVARVKDDIRRLVSAGHRRLSIEDNFFAHAPLRTKQLCQAFRELRSEGVDFEWDCQTRVESLARPSVITDMATAGCVATYVGIESLIEQQLLYLNKTKRPSDYLNTFGNTVLPDLLSSPIECFINVQFGIPDESDADYEKTIDLLENWGHAAETAGKRLTLFPQLHVVYPGTQHFRDGLLQKRFSPDVFESFTEWEATQQPVLKWLGEHFAHGTGGLPEGILESSMLARGEFKIRSNAVMRIDTYLTRIRRQLGIAVFDYGSYLRN